MLPALGAFAATITVGGSGADHTSIRSALDAASNGDTIEIWSGTYDEELTTSKQLDIWGVGRPILTGSGRHKILSISDGARIHLKDLIFEDGYCVDAGAAVDIRFDCDVRIENCEFRGNYADYQAGAVHARHQGTDLRIEACVFENNSTVTNGGALTVILGAHAFVDRSTFLGNDGGDYSGAIGINNAFAEIRDCLFNGNEARNTGAIRPYSATTVIEGCTFVRNVSHLRASVSVINGFAKLDRNIFYVDEAGAGLHLQSASTQRTCNIYYRNVAGAVLGDVLDPTEMEVNPMFCDPGARDFTVAFGSPAAPDGNACGDRVGAFGVGCSGAIPTHQSSFSRLKTRF
jgi:hypothetical protein